MRSYGQFCAVAKALDLIGDRWALLVVRELLINGPSRYTDLKRGLPGIATNLLATRLRELERSGIVRSQQAPPPVATTLFSLTDRGRELEPVLAAIGRWGGSLLTDSSGDAFQSHWLTLPLRLHLRDGRPEEPPVTVELRTGDEPLLVRAAGGAVTVTTGQAGDPDAVLAGPPEATLALLLGRIGLQDAERRGVRFRGPSQLLARLRPDPAAAGVRKPSTP